MAPKSTRLIRKLTVKSDHQETRAARSGMTADDVSSAKDRMIARAVKFGLINMPIKRTTVNLSEGKINTPIDPAEAAKLAARASRFADVMVVDSPKLSKNETEGEAMESPAGQTQ